MSWIAVTPSLPAGVNALGSAITQGLGALRAGLELVRLQAQATALLATTTESAAVNAANQALSAVVTASNAALDVLLDSSGLYVLAVPVPKKGLARLISDATTNGYNESPSG